jgi:uncharacterized NAD-dependent epimerase/dehydratase family protein
MGYDPGKRVVIYAQEEFGRGHSKTAEGVLRYGRNPVLGVIDRSLAGKYVSDVMEVGEGIPFLADIEQAALLNPEALLLGTAPRGGKLPPAWRDDLNYALSHGMDIINGLHQPLGGDPQLKQLAELHGREIWDTREPPEDEIVGSGLVAELNAQVVLTVGSDCAVGKMTATLELDREARGRGRRSLFVPTGQTGIMIAGFGVSIDRVIGDFMAGAMEKLILDHADDNDLLLIEGQGSLLHPGYSGVTLGLIHGAMPTDMILCHQPTRKYIRDSRIEIPPLPEVIHLYEENCLPPRKARVIGIALNCWGMTDSEALAAVESAENDTGLPATDVLRFGAARLMEAVDAALEKRT